MHSPVAVVPPQSRPSHGPIAHRVISRPWSLAQIGYDFFEIMEENGYHYGYRMSSTEALGVSVGMWNFVEDYVNTHLRPHIKTRCAVPLRGARLAGFHAWPRARHPSLWGVRGL